MSGKRNEGTRGRDARPRAADHGPWWLVPALIGLALAPRIVGIGAGLPDVYEEAYPFKHAWDMWGWGPARGFDLNPHFFKYPGLTFYLQFAGQALLYAGLSITGAIQSSLDFRALYVMDKTPFYLMGRGLTALLGALTVWPAFALGRRAGGRVAGVGAALLVAINPALIARSRVIEVDVPLALLVCLGVACALQLSEARTRRHAAIAGLVAGLAASAKYPGAVLLVPCALALFMGWGARANAGANSGAARRGRADAPLVPLAALGTVLACAALAFVLTSPWTLIDWKSFTADLAAEREHMALGHFGVGDGPSWPWYARQWCFDVMGWPLGISSAAGLVWFAAVRRERWAILIAAVVVPVFVVVGSWTMKAERYLLPLVPLGCVLGVALAGEIVRRVPALAAAPARTRGLAAAVATCLLALPSLAGLASQWRTLGPDSRTAARQWIERTVPAGAFIASEPYGPPLVTPLEAQSIERDLVPVLRVRGWAGARYAVQEIPMFQVQPERSARFYDPELLAPADYVVVTSPVRDRYREEPQRFTAQLAFYDTLATRFEKAQEFGSAGAGGIVTVWRNPAHAAVFQARRDVAMPDTALLRGGVSGGEAYFYFNIGLNHEAFGKYSQAVQAYLLAMRFPATRERLHTRSALQVARLLSGAGRSVDAAAFLKETMAAPVDDGEREVLGRELMRLGG